MQGMQALCKIKKKEKIGIVLACICNLLYIHQFYSSYTQLMHKLDGVKYYIVKTYDVV